jgi:hypothetical protein
VFAFCIGAGLLFCCLLMRLLVVNFISPHFMPYDLFGY